MATSPHAVSSPAAGTRYEARAWIRSEVPGRTACLRDSRVAGGRRDRHGPGLPRLRPSAWEQFAPIAYTATGGDSIEVYAYQLNSVTGDSFDLDGVTLTAVP